jgi:hypothetical protein
MNKMEVFALVGDSGTGKSTSALQFAYDKNIPAIIDDGLLIINGRKVAGTSAKYEKNYITAIKRATFHDTEHKDDVQTCIRRLQLNRILLIGTSKKMVDFIAEKLQVGVINHYINVKDIRSKHEIKMALFIRKTQNQHVIPIPYVQVESTIFKKLIYRGKKIFSNQKKLIGETTIVQPNFQKGSITISENIIKEIVSFSCLSKKEVINCRSVHFKTDPFPTIECQFDLSSSLYQDIKGLTVELQELINDIFNNYFEIELYTVDIHIAKLTIIEKIQTNQ